MCIAYLAIRCHRDWPLLIAANRDEFHARATLAAAPWADHPDIIAGIDCVARGSWLGVTRQGRFALLTNYRDPASNMPDAPSRGALVSRYLCRHEDPQQYIRDLSATSQSYNGFNFIAGDLNQACYLSNRGPDTSPQALQAQRYIVSNHLLDTAWPKAQRLRQGLDQLAPEQWDGSLTSVFNLLKDTTQAVDHLLPATDISLDRERLLSSPFIVSPDYGTRCSTVIAIHASGRAFLSEVSYDPQGVATQRHDWPFLIKSLVSTDESDVHEGARANRIRRIE